MFQYFLAIFGRLVLHTPHWRRCSNGATTKRWLSPNTGQTPGERAAAQLRLRHSDASEGLYSVSCPAVALCPGSSLGTFPGCQKPRDFYVTTDTFPPRTQMKQGSRAKCVQALPLSKDHSPHSERHQNPAESHPPSKLSTDIILKAGFGECLTLAEQPRVHY